MERLEEKRLGIYRLWRNPSIRNLSLVLTALLIMAVVLIALYSHYSTERLKKSWMDKEAAMIGSLVAEQPEWAAKWITHLVETDKPSPESVAEGYKVLDQYGLTTALESDWFPVLGGHQSRTFWSLIGGAIVFMILIALFVFREISKQLQRIRTLANSLEDTVKHNQPMSYLVYDEGELGLLANGAQELTIRLRETIEQLHRDKAFLKDTVSDISHQLKTPLASLMIYIDLLREGNVDAGHAAEFLATCRRELDRMEWLTLALLKLARLEADALEMSMEEIPLADTLTRAKDSVRRLADDKTIDIKIEKSASDTSVVLPHDSHWLAEAFMNLLKNAIEHSPSGSTVAVSLENTPVFIRLQIKDQGPGIAAQHLPHIFKKFYRSSSEGSGVGLGLPLAKSIVEKHGGVLSVLPNPSGGTIFNIALPHHPFSANSTKLTKL
ncbi:HAMP domain-containing sensor histidine kinase [Cohnella sp. WQ 127256]|uniref:sensor histidine kinase n=1 Tax=Cohnella sp. WQ 127256 TaxID=2938790 RepID=UPI002117C77B|nr:HAMP domain-containing sensor histidine kinase [Cohnella sp. WQ 127256]